ncbi:hypothetical protein TRFO_25258 [Tritrichomonas foetus]|uniref:Cleavage/polyadenylation specificity factor A subunit N-terminal domain-containing protein n=1 Tax=Tritrichomonas foetus TaxID=1144522 RepID=A0A1J4K5H6_9EUKA|nr:hypothetical protein TRFO_25258 [Tritrichomonas foetus]|eukprot:OHT06647.1 hypothetical protein TRFO_25258 [Tritrichomonas foetus]
MEKSKWIKQICFDNSIQILLCDHFIHPTVNDCVVVGHSSLRLIIMKSNNIIEIARYNHSKPIISASIVHRSNHIEICFISGQLLYFAAPTLKGFNISEPVPLNFTYSSVTSNALLICLYPRNSSLTFYDHRITKNFINFDLAKNSKVWSCAFMGENLASLEFQNVFRVKIYNTKNLNYIRCVATYSINYYTPYRIISVPSHNSFYVLAESTIFHIQSSEKGWIFNKHSIDIRRSDPLLVDATPCGVRLLVLSADGLVLRFDGHKFELVAELNGATLLSSLSISRFLITLESCRLSMLDRDMLPLDEITYANCIHSSYTQGNFTVASQNSIYTAFYDYGIEVIKYADLRLKMKPIFYTINNFLFILYKDKTVIIDSEFRDVTPSAIKKLTFERIHANSQNSFFGLTSDKITVFEYGSIFSFNEKSTHSAHRLNTLYTTMMKSLTSFFYTSSTLIKQNKKDFDSEIYAISVGNDICLSFRDGLIYIIDDEFYTRKKININHDIFSIISTERQIMLGSDTGEIVIVNYNLEIISEQSIGISRVYLTNVGNKVAASCENSYYHITEKGIKKLPPDFRYFSPFGNNETFIALLKVASKSRNYNLLQIQFTEQTLGFHHKINLELNQQITKINSAEQNADYVCCASKSTLLWSHGNTLFNLLENEEAKSINEWRANHSNKVVQFWVVCTKKGDNEGRLLIFLLNRKESKFKPLLQKVFNAPLVAFTASSHRLAFFVTNDTITGISLETGSLIPKAKSNAKITDVVAIDSSQKYIAALADQRKFSLFEIISDMELKFLSVVDRPAIYGRIKIIGNYVAVSSRVTPSLTIYTISENPQTVREIMLLSPVTSIFDVKGKIFCNCICGEMFMINCEDQEIAELDTSKLFSFSHSAYMLND